MPISDEKTGNEGTPPRCQAHTFDSKPEDALAGSESDKSSAGPGKGAKGKGFGTKDLAAMRARSQTESAVEQTGIEREGR